LTCHFDSVREQHTAIFHATDPVALLFSRQSPRSTSLGRKSACVFCSDGIEPIKVILQFLTYPNMHIATRIRRSTRSSRSAPSGGSATRTLRRSGPTPTFSRRASRPCTTTQNTDSTRNRSGSRASRRRLARRLRHGRAGTATCSFIGTTTRCATFALTFSLRVFQNAQIWFPSRSFSDSGNREGTLRRSSSLKRSRKICRTASARFGLSRSSNSRSKPVM
jgi:hypothetical protein